MDNSNPTPPAAPVVIPEAPQAPLNPTPAPEAVNTSGGGNMKLWIIVGLVVLLLILGGVYFYLNSQKAEMENTAPASTTEVQPTTVPVSNLESEANSIEIESADNDFTTVDADLNNL